MLREAAVQFGVDLLPTFTSQSGDKESQNLLPDHDQGSTEGKTNMKKLSINIEEMAKIL